MIKTLFEHKLKAFWRGTNMERTLGVWLLIAVIGLYFCYSMLLIGLNLSEFLELIGPSNKIIQSFCGTILTYFLIDFILRLQFQSLPTLQIIPYLPLPIRPSTVFHYLSLCSILSFFNFLPLLLFTPFILDTISHHYGSLAGASFLVALVGFILINNFLLFLVKRKAGSNAIIFWMTILVISVGLIADFYFDLYKISFISSYFFLLILRIPSFCILPVILGLSLYAINYVNFKDMLNVDDLESKTHSQVKSATNIPFLHTLGLPGELVSNELKLITRNKRPRTALMMSAILLLYGVVLYKGSDVPEIIYLIMGLMLTGVFIIQYGQYMYGWQSSHFDGMMISEFTVTDFLKSKFIIFTMVSAIAFLLTIPYLYFGWKVVLVNLVMLIWNIGVSSTLILFYANRNYRSIDLSKGAIFGWEGVNGSQIILAIPLYLVPIAIFYPFKYFAQPLLGYTTLFVIGIGFIVSRNYWIEVLDKDFHSKKYKIAEGFRK